MSSRTERLTDDSTRSAALCQDMVRIDGGEFRMGSDAHYPEEALAHRVRVNGFFIAS